MSPVLLFILLLLVTFAVVFYFMRPSREEKTVQQHLAGIEESRYAGPSGIDIRKKEQTGSGAWVEDIIARFPGSDGLRGLVSQSGQGYHLGPLVIFSLIAVVVGTWVASWMISSVALSFLVGLLLGLSPWAYLYIRREMRFRRFETLLPEAVDLMARGLRAGHGVGAVLEMVGQEVEDPVGAEFRSMTEEQNLGLPLRDAMLNLLDRVPLDDVRFLATAILLQKETGGNLALILDKTAFVMRERSRLRGQLRIYTAQGRITGWILCFVPFIIFGLISISNRTYETALFSDPMGLKMVYGGLVLMAVGVLIIRKIINVKV
jgi:tight adherence protein B